MENLYDNMLIDGRNAVYRAMYAGLSDPVFMSLKQDFAVIFFRFVHSYLNKFRPAAVHFFWDTPKERVWRRALLEEYKAGREPQERYKDFDVNTALSKTTEAVVELSKHINCRSYYKETQEADDLIYAFCRQYKRDKSLIVSSDGDFKQIPFLFNTVDLHNPLSKKHLIIPVEDVDPVDIKCFMGEDTDNITGYPKVGPVTARELSLNPTMRASFFSQHDDNIYIRNRKITDLSVAPNTIDNCMYINQVMAEQVSFDVKGIYQTIQKFKIAGLSGEINKTLLPFKFLKQEEK